MIVVVTAWTLTLKPVYCRPSLRFAGVSVLPDGLHDILTAYVHRSSHDRLAGDVVTTSDRVTTVVLDIDSLTHY